MVSDTLGSHGHSFSLSVFSYHRHFEEDCLRLTLAILAGRGSLSLDALLNQRPLVVTTYFGTISLMEEIVF
ncbi:hypothetical protein BaRGS_00003507, partial [Batillaria attramentaria]